MQCKVETSHRVKAAPEIELAPFHVQSKVCKFAPHMDRRNADFTPHMEQRYSFRAQQKAKSDISAIFSKYICQTTFILGVYMTYVTAFENISIFKQSTFKSTKDYRVD